MIVLSCPSVEVAFQVELHQKNLVCVSSCLSIHHGSSGETHPQQKTRPDESVLHQQHPEDHQAERGGAS